MSATRNLASYVSRLKYEDLPPSVVGKAKLLIMDAVGNAMGGYVLDISKTFLNMAKDIGGGSGEATLIGDGTKVSVPLAAFGNGALSTLLDYSDYHFSDSGRCPAWPGALDVPAALVAGETRGISGKELIASVVAGYECAARIIHSMDMTEGQVKKVKGETVSVFAAVGGAGRALGLGEDEMLSAIGMAGIYTPVSGYYRWVYDEGLTPRKDIKQGWAWMCMTGAFAAVSAQRGLRMLQENNILDGDKGLWRMLGMDIFNEEAITAGFGEKFYIEQFASKFWPGAGSTHTAMECTTGLVKEHNVPLDDVDRIEIIANKHDATGFNTRELINLSDMEFSMPYQVSAALIAGDKRPNWYTDSTAKGPGINNMMQRVAVSFDEECDRAFRERLLRLVKVSVLTKSGKRYDGRLDQPGEVRDRGDARSKFITTTSQVVDRGQAHTVLSTIENLEAVNNISELIALLRIPAPPDS